MKYLAVFATFALAIGTASSQSACAAVASKIPPCGQACLISAGSAVGCAQTDYACQCSSSGAIQNSAINCVLSSCGAVTGIAVQASASAVCACVATVPANNTASATATASQTRSATPGSSTGSSPPANSGGKSHIQFSAAIRSEPEESAPPTIYSTRAIYAGGSCGSATSSPPAQGDSSLTYPTGAAPSTLTTSYGSASAGNVTVTVTVTKTATGECTITTSSCKGKEGTDYLICCVNKIFTLGD